MSVQAHHDSAELLSDSESSPISTSEQAETSSSTPQTSQSTVHTKHHQNASSKMAVKFFKTKLCPWYSQGRCRLGNNCNWAHNLQEVRDSVDLSRTKLCHHLTTHGKCTDPTCRFAHRREELRATTDVYKTSLCVFWMRGGCFIGQKCRYAHGLNDLRHYSSASSHRPASRPDLLMLDSPKERDTEGADKEATSLKVGKMGWTDPSLAAVAQALSSSSGIRVGNRQLTPSFDLKGSPHGSPSTSPETPKSTIKSRSTRVIPQSRETPPTPNSQRTITQEELMTAMEALQSLLKVPQHQSAAQTPCEATSLGQLLKSCSPTQTASSSVPLRRKVSSSSSPAETRSNDAATSRLLAIAEKMTNLEFASRETSEEGFTSSELRDSSLVLEPSFKDLVDSLSWDIPGTMRDSESSIRDIAKRLEEIDVRARLGLVQELKAAAVLSVVAANATLTTAEDLNSQISDMLTTMRRAHLPWHLPPPGSKGTDDQTTSASTHLGSNSERTDSVSNGSWRSNFHMEEAKLSPGDTVTSQEDLMLSQLLEVIRRTHTRL